MPQPVAWWRVVKASTRLGANAAKLWDEIRYRDGGPGGCWATVELLGRATGLSSRTVEGLRDELRRVGLLTVEREGRRVHCYARLPEQCYPQSERPTDAEVFRLADLLDVHLAQVQGGAGGSSAGPDRAIR